MSNSERECCRAAAGLFKELYNLPNSSVELTDEMFNRVLDAWQMELYEEFHPYLIPVLTSPQKKEHEEKAFENLMKLGLETCPLLMQKCACLICLGNQGKPQFQPAICSKFR